MSNATDAEGDRPTDAVYTDDGLRLVVAHRDSADLTLFDAQTFDVLGQISLSGGPASLAIAGNLAVTANILEDTASLVDLLSGTELATVPVGREPTVARVTSDGTFAVIGNSLEQTLSVIDVASRTEIWRLGGAGFDVELSIDRALGDWITEASQLEVIDNRRAVHLDRNQEELEIIDLPTGTITTIPLAARPYDMDVTPDGLLAAISHRRQEPAVTLVDLSTPQILATYPLSSGADGPIAIAPTGGRVALRDANECVVLDLLTGTWTESNVGASGEVLATSDGQYVLTTSRSGALLSFASRSIVAELKDDSRQFDRGVVSPIEPRAVLFESPSDESLVVLNTNGAAGFQERILSSGPGLEADRSTEVAVSADGRRGVSVNRASGTLSILDLDRREVVAVVPVGLRPQDVALTPDGRTAVVANQGSEFISIVDLDQRSVTSVPSFAGGLEVEISPDGATAWVALTGGPSVRTHIYQIDIATASFIASTTVRSMVDRVQPFGWRSGMAVSPDGQFVVTCSLNRDNVTLISTAQINDSIELEPPSGFSEDLGPAQAVFNAGSDRLYVTASLDDSVIEVRRAGNDWVFSRRIPVGARPWDLALSQDGRTLYVTNLNSQDLSIIDLVAGTETHRIPLDDSPTGLALGEGDGCLWVATGHWQLSRDTTNGTVIDSAGRLRIFDTLTLQVTDDVSLGTPPVSMAFDASGKRGVLPAPTSEELFILEHARR